jgi:hypothetical protein
MSGSYDTVTVEAARLTDASATPGKRLMAFSTLFAHEAQCIRSTGNVFFILFCCIKNLNYRKQMYEKKTVASFF